MKQELIDLAKYRLEKAKNTLLDAKKYIEDATLVSVVNRIYYAMFYAVSALLITKELFSSKHSGILSLFSREIINKGLMERQYGKFYSEMFNNRQEGDYKDFTEFEKKDVEDWLKMAEKFISEIEDLTLAIIEKK
ncbi:MAG: HEPN domain-containing protein [bacterium]